MPTCPTSSTFAAALRRRRARRSAPSSTRPPSPAGPEVRVIHGRGTGAVRRAVRDELARHPLVESQDSDSADGATLARAGRRVSTVGWKSAERESHSQREKEARWLPRCAT